MRILLSAFYLSPFRGSEAGVGWRIAEGLSKKYDVTILCGDFTPGGITAGDLKKFRDQKLPTPNLEIHEIRADKIAQILHKLHALPGMWFFYYLAYERWQRQALKLAQELHCRAPFDLAHHVNIIGFRQPGYLWKLGIPWFWGPIAGASMIPWGFFSMMSRAEQFRWGSRNLINSWQMRHSPRCIQAAKHARRIWGVTPEDCHMVSNLWKVPVESMLETGTTPVGQVAPRTYHDGEILKLAWSGLFQGRKALPLLLEALALVAQKNWELHILGQGPEEKKWRAIAGNLGISDHLRWHGLLERNAALVKMNECHLLVHSSVKEGTPHVVMEALTLGLPVMCHDSCGMGTAVDAGSGIKVPLRNPMTSIAGFRHGLQGIFLNPSLIAKLSAGAIARASQLSWDTIIEKLSDAYEEELAQKALLFNL